MVLKTLIIDDHPLVSEGLSSLVKSLDEDGEVFNIQDALQAVEKALEIKPDLILLDLHMPGADGFEVLTTLSEKLAATPVVIISGSVEPADMQRAISLGAMGYIPKIVSSNIMEKALQLVMSGGVYIPPEMLNGSAQAPIQRTRKNDGQLLTPRQIEVLALLSEGKVNKEIARQLDCAETTVKAHITAIFKELGARNRTEAVVQAQRLGFIDSEQ